MRSTMPAAPLSVARILRHGATTHARSEVLTWDAAAGSPRRRTFAETEGDAAALAHALRELGVDADQRVATFMANNAEHLTCYLAVPSMGAVLHTLNIRLAPREVAWIADHASDHVVVVDAALVPPFAEVLPYLTAVRHVIVVGDADRTPLRRDGIVVHEWADLLAGQARTFDWPVVDEHDAAALCYTSGTTGRPRGVAYSHRSIWLHSLQLMTAEAYGLSDADTALVVVPQFHAMAWGFPFAAFMSGCSLLLNDGATSADQLVAMIEQLRPTYAAAVPAVWAPVLELADRTHPDLSSLREVAIGGAACPPSLMRGFEERHGVRVVHAWGMTETSPYGTIARPPAHVTDDEERWRYRITQGRLPASVEGRLVDADGAFVPHDGQSVGELEVRGPWVTSSYVDDPEADALTFHDGWLRTGDVGTLTADGYWTVTDRLKDVISSGGEWISSVALEHALVAHPSVRDAAVIAVPDERWGERPFALIAPTRHGSEVDLAALRGHLGEEFPRWQLPDWWACVDDLPRTATGKLDKRALRAAFASGALLAERHAD